MDPWSGRRAQDHRSEEVKRILHVNKLLSKSKRYTILTVYGPYSTNRSAPDTGTGQPVTGRYTAYCPLLQVTRW
jgi:adenylylsulfate kinase-like enzyme